MFESLTIPERRPIVFMKRTFQVIVGLYLLIGLIAAYRMFYQVHSLELRSSERVLRTGSTITTDLVSYARTPISIDLELIQGTHVEVLAWYEVSKNDWAFLDPRWRQASENFVVTPEVLARLQNGPAVLRATAFGRMQLSRVPPPVVREVAVEIQR